MNVAELFVNLGIKGSEKTVGALSDVKKGLGGIKDTSLEAKAAIVGAMYGLERMMAISGAAGTNLTNFSALTGLSARSLQQWQFAARQAGVSNDELTGSLKGVQNSMANMLLGKGAPEGIALLSKAVGGIDPKRYRDTFYMMTKLQEGIQKMTPEMGAMVGKSFGLSEGVIAGMRRNVFTPDMLAKAPTYSDKEIASLDKSNIAWSNLANTIQMAFGRFNAKHGQELVGDITKLVPHVVHLAEAFTKLAETVHLFQGITKVFDGWILIFDKLTAGVKMFTSGFSSGGKNDSFMTKVDKGLDQILPSPDDLATYFKYLISPGQPDGGKPGAGATTINQNITHIGDAKDTKSVKDLHKSAINHAYRQRSAQNQGA
jgi:hypothetical protein